MWLHMRRQAPVGLAGRGATPFPCPGGWQDQPAALMDAFSILDGFVADEK
jgi:hypothetical protein